MGSAPRNQIIASGFGATGIKAVFGRYFIVFGRSIPRLWRAWRPRPPGAASPTALRGILSLPELPEPQNNQQQPMERPEKGIRASAQADGGGRFFSKIASLAALANSNNRPEPIRRPILRRWGRGKAAKGQAQSEARKLALSVLPPDPQEAMCREAEEGLT
jgi:hypothetical protein